MPKKLRFLITDGYPEPSREKFNDVGMRLAWELYRDMLGNYVPDAEVDVWFASDAPSDAPAELASYDGLLWPGCNLTVFDVEKESVTSQHDLVRRAYEEGIPQFGSCWGIQIAVYVAGGTVRPNPRGREMGIGQKMRLTEAGRNHPMFRGKPLVYSHFVSHDDEVSELPPGATLLAGNDFSRVQAVEVKYERGVFWGIQYHPEYDLHEMARLIVAREERLVKQGLFRDHDDLVQHVDRLEALAADPERKDLRWQLGIDDDILRDDIRRCEFVNWLRDQVGVDV